MHKLMISTYLVMDKDLFKQKVSTWLKDKETLKQINWDIQNISSAERPKTVKILANLTISFDDKQYRKPRKSETEDCEYSIRSAVEALNEFLLQWIDECEEANYNQPLEKSKQ